METKVGRKANPNNDQAVAEVLEGGKVKEVALKYGMHFNTLYQKVREAKRAQQ